MNFEKVFIDGLLVVQPDVFLDERGYFFESFNKEKYVDGGINFSFVQDNISKSKKGTVRGLHYQVGESAQGKLCSPRRNGSGHSARIQELHCDDRRIRPDVHFRNRSEILQGP